MAGIMANSASVTMDAGDTSADKSLGGYLSRETITLSVTPSGSTYSWALAKPTTSGVTCALRGATTDSPSFTPDVEGYYVVTCLVDGETSYVFRAAVASVSAVSSLTALRFMPAADDTIPTPAVGATLFYSSDLDSLAYKLPNGTVTAL
jgi:hypothetical protein